VYDAPPVEHRPADLVLADRCGASASGPTTRGSGMALERWVALRDAIVAWASDRPDPDVDQVEQDIFGTFDPVQRSILSRYFTACRHAIGDAEVDADPAPARVFSPDGRTVLRQAITFVLSHPEGDREAIRLTLGSPSDGEIASVLALGADPETPVADLLADVGHVEPVEIDPAVAQPIVDRLLGIAIADREPIPVPGFHCWRCDRTATCGAYRDPWDTGRPPARTRTIKLSRSTLSALGTCERKVAWKAIHQVPTPSEDTNAPHTGLVVGSAFHRAMETALLDDAPDAVIATHALGLAPSEQADLHLLWDRHRDLVATEPCPVAVARTEYPIGLSIPLPDLETVVVVIGQVDAAGREADGTPAVVEHRTGRRTEIPHLEAEMYAVATWQTTGSTTVAIHHHHLRSEEEPCVRRVFTEADLHAALDSLREAARTIAGWDPADSLAPGFSVGPWCDACDYAATCAAWR
jgi:hypothetical protein